MKRRMYPIVHINIHHTPFHYKPLKTDTPHLQLHIPRRLLLQHKSLVPLTILAARGVLVVLGPPSTTAVAAANVPIALPTADRFRIPVAQPGPLACAPTPCSRDRKAQCL